MMSYQTFFAAISVFAATILLLLGLLYFVRPSFLFWPPPSKTSWQSKVFITLFRAMLYSLIVASVLIGLTSEYPFVSFKNFLGVFLLSIGFGLAFFCTWQLGWKNAFGEKDGLRTHGFFAYSRNPIYLFTWIGLLGWGIIIEDSLVRITLFGWALCYLVAIFLEERWLRRVYGSEYSDHCTKVKRFF